MEAEALDIQSLALEHSCLESRYVNKLGAHNAPTLCRGLFKCTFWIHLKGNPRLYTQLGTL